MLRCLAMAGCLFGLVVAVLTVTSSGQRDAERRANAQDAPADESDKADLLGAPEIFTVKAVRILYAPSVPGEWVNHWVRKTSKGDYVLQDGRELVCVSPHGSIRWRHKVSLGSVRGVTPEGNRLLITTTAGHVLCLDSSTGRLQGQTRVTARDGAAIGIEYPGLVTEDCILVPMCDGRVATVDTRTWTVSYAESGNAFLSQPVLLGNEAVMATEKGLVFVDRKGRPVRTEDWRDDGFVPLEFPAIRDGVMATARRQSFVFCDLRTGRVIARVMRRNGGAMGSPLFLDGMLVVAGACTSDWRDSQSSSMLYGISIKTGRVTWVAQRYAPGEINNLASHRGSLVSVDENPGGNAPELVCRDPASGRIISRHIVSALANRPRYPTTSPPILEGSAIVFGTGDGTLCKAEGSWMPLKDKTASMESDASVPWQQQPAK